MRKSLFFLSCIIGLLTLAGCSKDDSAIDSGNNTKSTKIRWYGVNTSDEISTRGVADESKLWNQKVGITIKFINNPADANMIEKIKSIASEWEDYAGIKFNYVESDKNASVRIAFDWQGNDWLTWSYTGTDAKYVRSQAEPTAIFGGLEYADEEQFKGDVLRVFGQILGLEYEQRHQDWTFWKSEAQLQHYWEGMLDGMNIDDWNEIRDYVFTPLSGENAIFPTQTPQIDELSVMAWPYYARNQVTKLMANFELSEGDKAFIAQLYPKQNQSLPTIQEAWVDTGFFIWRTKENSPEVAWKEGMVALKLTKLGAQQEYFSDVSDGEQLTFGYKMFCYLTFQWSYPNTTTPIVNPTKLKKMPKFNSSNITNWGFIFAGNVDLVEIESLDTSNGTDFHDMFYNCTSLVNVPYLNTAKGIDFSEMFYNCRSLTQKPNLDLSKATNTSNMYQGTPFANDPL